MTRASIAGWAVTVAATIAYAAQTAPTPARDPQPPIRDGGRQRRAGRGPGDPTVKAWAVYDQRCAACHGRNLEGGAAGSLLDDVWKFGGDDAHLVETIREGRKGTPMVAFKDLLTEQQIWELVLLIRREAAEAKVHPPTIVDPDGEVVRSEKQAFRIEVVARDLETPWGIAFLPDGRMLVTERPGRLRIVEKGRLLAEPVAGTPKTWAVQDGGLLDVEVHPRYAENGWIYLSYAAPGPSDTSMTAIVRGRIREHAWVDEQAIYAPPPELFGPENYHYGSRFLFDRQGKLVYSIGDRGRPKTAQDLGSPLGKVHRVNDDGTVPSDNPFVGREGAVPTIWTYGHRNSQGFAIDLRTGLLWESEHGPTGGDELNVLDAGHNYGWPVISHGLEPGIAGTTHEGMEAPIVAWNPTIAPSGIHFYEGTRYARWRNDLFVAGLGGTALRRLEVDGRRVTRQEVLFDRYGRVRDVVTGPDGLLYVLLQLPGARLFSSTPGVVVRLVPIE
jgi:aldose sugar dehydrogenase